MGWCSVVREVLKTFELLGVTTGSAGCLEDPSVQVTVLSSLGLDVSCCFTATVLMLLGGLVIVG